MSLIEKFRNMMGREQKMAQVSKKSLARAMANAQIDSLGRGMGLVDPGHNHGSLGPWPGSMASSAMPPSPWPTTIGDISEMQILLRLRLSMSDLSKKGVDIVGIRKIEGDRVAVFITYAGKPVILEDEYEMFPSDSLITRFKVML